MLSLFVCNPKTLLDYGCGNGHTIEYLQTRWPNTRYHGIDISPEALRLAGGRCPHAQFSQEIPGSLFDVILLMGVAEHFKSFILQMRRITKRLASGGLIYLEMPNNLAMTERKVGGWFENNGQMEWHLPRWNWEEQIDEAGLYIEEALFGPRPACEFVWILRPRL